MIFYSYHAVPDDNGTYLVTIEGLPGATDAEDKFHAYERAQALLEHVLLECISKQSPIPRGQVCAYPDDFPSVRRAVAPSIPVLDHVLRYLISNQTKEDGQ